MMNDHYKELRDFLNSLILTEASRQPFDQDAANEYLSIAKQIIKSRPVSEVTAHGSKVIKTEHLHLYFKDGESGPSSLSHFIVNKTPHTHYTMIKGDGSGDDIRNNIHHHISAYNEIQTSGMHSPGAEYFWRNFVDQNQDKYKFDVLHNATGHTKPLENFDELYDGNSDNTLKITKHASS
jgi:hypothetical protein